MSQLQLPLPLLDQHLHRVQPGCGRHSDDAGSILRRGDGARAVRAVAVAIHWRFPRNEAECHP